MALSYCNNWGFSDPLTTDMGQLHQPDVDNQLLNFDDDLFLAGINELFSMDAEASAVLPPTDDPSVHLSPLNEPNLLPDAFDRPTFNQHPQPCPKRSRSVEGLCQCSSHPLNTTLNPFDQTVHGFNGVLPSYFPQFPLPPPTAAVEYRIRHDYENVKKTTGNGGLSSQSMAARERRKRISNNTQKLGRLVPGGNKMNTAEMFQAAANYVRFLQAQVGILGLMAKTTQEETRLRLLLTSPSVQERLYHAERCIVPKRMVEDLTMDRVVRSHPSISRDLGLLVKSMKDEKLPLTEEEDVS